MAEEITATWLRLVGLTVLLEHRSGVPQLEIRVWPLYSAYRKYKKVRREGRKGLKEAVEHSIAYRYDFWKEDVLRDKVVPFWPALFSALSPVHIRWERGDANE